MLHDQLVTVIEDSIQGPYYGTDFTIDNQGCVQAHDVKTAAMIMRRVNLSGQWSQRLVVVARRGDCVIMDFDSLQNSEPVFATDIGPDKAHRAEVKQDSNNRFCVYINGKRMSRQFAKLSAARAFIKKQHQELENLAQTVLESAD